MENEVIEAIPAANMPVKLGVTKQAIAKLKKKYSKCPDATTPEGYTSIKMAKSELTPLRTGVEKERKLQVSSALAHQKRVNAEAKEITLALEAIEAPLYAAKKAVDDEADRIKAESEEKEAARISLIEERIEAVNELVNGLLNAVSSEISEQLKIAENIVTSSFEEYEDTAIESRNSAIETLKTAYEERVIFETQQAEQEKQARIMAEQQAKLDEKQAELDAKEAEQKQAEREEQIKKEAAEKATKDAELAAQDKIDAAKLCEREAAEKVEKAEREAAETEARIKRELAESEAQLKREADAREADKEHKKAINNAAVKCLVEAGVSESAAKKCITAIAQRKVENVVISY